MNNNYKIYLNKEVTNQIEKLPKQLSLQLLYQLYLCEKRDSIFKEVFKDIETRGVNHTEPIKHLKFAFQQKIHSLLAYRNNKTKRIGVLSYSIKQKQEKISAKEISSLRKKAYLLNIKESKKRGVGL